MDNEMEIIEITDDTIASLPETALDFIFGGPGPRVKLGSIKRDERVSSILHGLAEKAETLWFLRWKGTKTPHGAVLGKVAVSHAQNGIVCSDGGDMIGTYERLVEWGGPNHDEHMMLIWTS